MISISSRFDEDCQETANTLAWIPFGVGPRICLGMRFAILEYKIALTRIVKKFTIERCAETKVPCPTKKNGAFTPSEGVYVKLKRRNWIKNCNLKMHERSTKPTGLSIHLKFVILSYVYPCIYYAMYLCIVLAFLLLYFNCGKVMFSVVSVCPIWPLSRLHTGTSPGLDLSYPHEELTIWEHPRHVQTCTIWISLCSPLLTN